jgi:hypothetical protein
MAKMSIYDFKEYGWLKNAEVGSMPEEASSGGKQFASNNNVRSFFGNKPSEGLKRDSY